MKTADGTKDEIQTRPEWMCKEKSQQRPRPELLFENTAVPWNPPPDENSGK